MIKDPAFLFYSADFLTGTFTMTHEQVGKYIRLLCLQHQKGPLAESDLLAVCGMIDEPVFSKFQRDPDTGLFQNQRLAEETRKRRKYSESRKNNRSSSAADNHMSNICGTYDKDMSKICKTYVPHMENENINIIVNTDLEFKEDPAVVQQDSEKEENPPSGIQPSHLNQVPAGILPDSVIPAPEAVRAEQSGRFPNLPTGLPAALPKGLPVGLSEVTEYITGTYGPEFSAEAENFFSHYESQGWRTSAGMLITNWQAKARQWIINQDKFRAPPHGNTETAQQRNNREFTDSEHRRKKKFRVN